jgi:hypothetical protein
VKEIKKAELHLEILMTENTARKTIEGEESGARPSGSGVRRMLAAFTYRDFRVQWIGACSSAIGTWLVFTGTALMMVFSTVTSLVQLIAPNEMRGR